MGATHGKLAAVYRWNGSAGNLTTEACTESGSQAQITDSAKRILNPNAAVSFTDSGGANLVRIDYAAGRAIFDAAVTVVTASGTGAYVAAANLVKAGYMYDWRLEVDLELAARSVYQDDWKQWQAAMGEISGRAAGFFAGSAWFSALENCVDASVAYFLAQLFTYDPDDDQTGDHYNAWVIFEGLDLSAPIAEMVREEVTFKVHGAPDFVLNA